MTGYIFRLSGQYFGFIDSGNVFSWNGRYLGWLESNYVWDASGQFRGELKTISGHLYVVKNMYVLPPLPKAPKQNPLPVTPIMPPQANVPPVTLELGWVDGFNEK
jgi:hypothetical protein